MKKNMIICVFLFWILLAGSVVSQESPGIIKEEKGILDVIKEIFTTKAFPVRHGDIYTDDQTFIEAENSPERKDIASILSDIFMTKIVCGRRGESIMFGDTICGPVG